MIPLSMYLFLPIRSAQGYGPINSLKDFFLYITGRYTTGQVHGGSFFDKDLESILKVAGEFFKIIYINYGIILLVIAVMGIVYLFIKNLKFAACSALAIVFNLAIMSMFIDWAAQNHVIITLMIISLYIAMGFLLIYDLLILLFRRIERKKNTGVKILKNITICILLILFLSFPVLVAFANYERADESEVEDIYLFWNKIFDIIEDGSSLYVSSVSANIGKYIDIYEKSERNIDFIQNKDLGYSLDNIKQDLKEGKNVYLVNADPSIMSQLNVQVLFDYLWPRFGEGIALYRVTDEKIIPDIEFIIDSSEVEFGEKFEIIYRIINNNRRLIKITSIEVEIPDSLVFENVRSSGIISVVPSPIDGKYIWVKDNVIETEEELILILSLRAFKPGKSTIKFGITSQDTFFKAEDAVIEIVQ
jgi:hypothetical protein